MQTLLSSVIGRAQGTPVALSWANDKFLPPLAPLHGGAIVIAIPRSRPHQLSHRGDYFPSVMGAAMKPHTERPRLSKPEHWSSLSFEEKRNELRELQGSHYWHFLPPSIQEHIRSLLHGENCRH